MSWFIVSHKLGSKKHFGKEKYLSSKNHFRTILHQGNGILPDAYVFYLLAACHRLYLENSLCLSNKYSLFTNLFYYK